MLTRRLWTVLALAFAVGFLAKGSAAAQPYFPPNGNCDSSHSPNPGPNLEYPPDELGQCHGIWGEIGYCEIGNAGVNCWEASTGALRCLASVTCPDGTVRKCGSLNTGYTHFFANEAGVHCFNDAGYHHWGFCD